MRRDYFTCVFLLYICVALLYVCFAPLYFTYESVVVRSFGLFEKIMSFIYALSALLVIPTIAAIKKKFWITLGAACYGIIAFLPVWIMPSLVDKLSGENASTVAVIFGYFWEAVYGMVNAPFAALSELVGDGFSSKLSLGILPMSIIIYIVVQLYRFYRDAYIAERLDPASVVDTTVNAGKEADDHKVRKVHIPEMLGTVISAPVVPTSTAPVPVAPVAPATPVPAVPTQAKTLPESNQSADKTTNAPQSPYDENGVIHL